MTSRVKKARDESGQSTVLFAVLFVVLCGFAAVSIDFGRAVIAKGEVQNAADAAALAAVQNLPNATQTANDYASKNGVDVAAHPPAVVTPYNGDSTKIRVTCTETVNYTFARILGLSSRNVTASAVAQKISTGLGGPFNYAIFNGDTSSALIFDGGTVIGSSTDPVKVHSNSDIIFNGSGGTVNGTAEAKGSMTLNGNCSITTAQAASFVNQNKNDTIGTLITSAANYIAMPDLSGQIKSGAVQKTGPFDNLNVNSDIFVNGEADFHGGTVLGAGAVMATGNIVFDGNVTNTSGNGAVCFYSESGNITFNGASTVYGTLYAPNGTIIFDGKSTVYGRVIAKNIIFNGGGDVSVVTSPGDYGSSSGSGIKLVG